MADKRKASWGSGELYDLLCLMMLGTCVWLLGVQLGAFRSLDRLIIEHNLADLFKLGFFMGLGAVAASASKSLRLRRAMRERDAAEARAAETARHDPLTGLANRRLFAERLDERRAGGSGGRLSVFVVDLDRFKPVNELYGYEAGKRSCAPSASGWCGRCPPRAPWRASTATSSPPWSNPAPAARDWRGSPRG